MHRNKRFGESAQRHLLVDRRIDLEAVQQQERLHCGVGDPHVAIQKRMIHHQGERERRSLLDGRSVEIDTIEGHSRLRQGGLKRSTVAHAGQAS